MTYTEECSDEAEYRELQSGTSHNSVPKFSEACLDERSIATYTVAVLTIKYDTHRSR